MLKLSIILEEIRDTQVLLNIKLMFLGYELLNSKVYFTTDVVNCEYTHTTDLIRWYYKTSRK